MTARSFAAWSTKSATWSRWRRRHEAARAPAGARVASSTRAGRSRAGLRPWQDIDQGPERTAGPYLREYAEDIRGGTDAPHDADPQAARLPQQLEEALRRTQPDAAQSVHGWRRDPPGDVAGGRHHQGRRGRHQGAEHRRPQPKADHPRAPVFGGGATQDRSRRWDRVRDRGPGPDPPKNEAGQESAPAGRSRSRRDRDLPHGRCREGLEEGKGAEGSQG